MINLTEQAKVLCKNLLDNGFNGIEFDNSEVDTSLKLEDVWVESFQQGELTPEQFENYRANYVCFIINPDWPYARKNSPYTEVNIDKGGFEKDLRQHIIETLGDDLDINYQERTGQWECIRKTYFPPPYNKSTVIDEDD